MYADDITLVNQCIFFEILENILTYDIGELNLYFKRWKLKPNPLKTEVTLFQLNNRIVSHKINVSFDGQEIKNSHHPKVLGVVLNRSLT